jgi:hypothetical protein
VSRAQERLALAGLLVLAFALRAGAALLWPNVYWPDEIFQSLEPAHRLLYGYGVVSWEWRLGARSWLFPGLLAGVMKLSAPLGPGSTGYVLGTTLALSALGSLPAWAAWRIARRRTGPGAALLAAFACAVWCELVYFAPKALNEVAAGHVLAAAVALAPVAGRVPARGRLFAVGLLFGLVVALRPHYGPAVLVGIALAYRAEPRRVAAPLLLGAGVCFALAGLLDALTWGVPFHSYLRNPHENLVNRRSFGYGTEPFYGYLKSFLRVWTIGFVPLLLLFAWGARRHPLPAWLAALALLLHSLIPHKEYRFVQPVIVLGMLVVAAASAELAERLALRRPGWRRLALPAAAGAWALASFAAAPRLSTEHLVRGDRGSDDPLYWVRSEGSKRSFTQLSLRDDVCGVALFDLLWSSSGGYTYLHHDVPLVELDESDGPNAAEARANYLLTRKLDAPRLGAYARERCWGPICLYRRPGGCEPPAGYDLSDELEARGH